jgi:hypothetical protein
MLHRMKYISPGINARLTVLESLTYLPDTENTKACEVPRQDESPLSHHSNLPLPRTAWVRCFEFDLPIYVSLTPPRFNVPEFTNSYESTAFLIGFVSRNVNGSALTGGEGHIDHSYKIHIQYCEPKDEEMHGHHDKKHTLQILSHSLGFGSFYWDIGGQENNYIAAANPVGYATLNYDRLGVENPSMRTPTLMYS